MGEASQGKSLNCQARNSTASIKHTMSISRDFDAWMDAEGIVPEAEVVPDHSCQVFLPTDGVRIFPGLHEGEGGHRKSRELETALKLMKEHLG